MLPVRPLSALGGAHQAFRAVEQIKQARRGVHEGFRRWPQRQNGQLPQQLHRLSRAALQRPVVIQQRRRLDFQGVGEPPLLTEVERSLRRKPGNFTPTFAALFAAFGHELG